MLRLWFCSVVAAVKRWVGGAFHCFLQLDIWLGSVQDPTPTSDILHQMFIHRVGDLRPANECESGNIFTAVVHLGQLTLEVADIRLETVRGSHFDGKEVVVVLLELLTRRVL